MSHKASWPSTQRAVRTCRRGPPPAPPPRPRPTRPRCHPAATHPHRPCRRTLPGPGRYCCHCRPLAPSAPPPAAPGCPPHGAGRCGGTVAVRSQAGRCQAVRCVAVVIIGSTVSGSTVSGSTVLGSMLHQAPALLCPIRRFGSGPCRPAQPTATCKTAWSTHRATATNHQPPSTPQPTTVKQTLP